jgi:hypothetical protein
MGFLKRLFSGNSEGDSDDPRPILEWPGREDDAVQLGRVEHLDVFLEDLRDVAPEGSILVIEGKPTQDVRDFLERVSIKPEVRIARNTIWPKQDFFHIPATRVNLDEILEFTLNHAEPEVCDHLVLYRDRQVLLWLHDASDGYVYGHPSLGLAQLERVRKRLKQKRR